jgi:hypothetical protein
MPLNNVEENIVKLLEKHPDGMMITEIADSLKTNRQTISKYVYGLTIAGIVEHREIGTAKLCFLVKKGKDLKRSLFALPLVMLILFASLALAQTQSHPLSQITPIDVNLNMTNAASGLNQNITGVGWLQYNNGIVFGSTQGIPTTDIQNFAVTTSKIALGAITNSLIANSAINGSQIQSGVISDSNLISNLGLGWGNVTGYNLNSAWTGSLGPGNITGGVLVGGSGTPGYIPMWNGTFSQNNSVIYQNLGNIGIGTVNPQNPLNVIGNINSTGVVYGSQLNGSLGWGNLTSYPSATSNQFVTAIGATLTYAAVTNAYLTPGIFSNIQGIGTQAQNLNMGAYSIYNANWVNATNLNATNDYETNLIATSWVNATNINATNDYETNVKAMNWLNATTLNISGAAYINGNVGIGTTAPLNALDVVGNVNATGNLYGNYLPTNSSPGSQGLVGYWTFDEGNGNYAHDSSGNGNTGTLTGSPQWLSGSNCVFGGCLNITSSSQDMTTQSSMNFGSVTLNLWIYPYAFPTGYNQHFLLVQASDGSFVELRDCSVSEAFPGSPIQLEVGNATVNSQPGLLCANYVAKPQWLMETGVVSWNSTAVTLNLYQNGVFQYSETVAINNMDLNGASVNILPNNGWAPTIEDDVRIYNRSLSASEISALYLIGADARSSISTGNLTVGNNAYVLGNVGIGTTSPSTTLQVNGTALITNSAAWGLGLQIYGGTAASGMNIMNIGNNGNNYNYNIGVQGTANPPDNALVIYDNVAQADRLVILPSGNVGIGTTSPTSNLQIQGASSNPSLTSGAQAIFDVYGTYGTDLVFTDSAASPYTFSIQNRNTPGAANAAYPIALNPLGGNVGIGTTNPIAPLNIVTNNSWQGIEMDSYQPLGEYNGMIMMEARGTPSAPSATLAGDTLGFIRFNGWNSSSAMAAQITAFAWTNFTSSNSPGYLVFSTTPVGSASPQTRMIIYPSGVVGFSSISTIGSVLLFAENTTPAGTTCTAACTSTNSNNQCLDAWTSAGVASTCGTSVTSGRCLCTAFEN